MKSNNEGPEAKPKEPFRKVGDSAKNDYEKGMPAAHTFFQVKSLALIADARKVSESLHSGGRRGVRQYKPEVCRGSCDR